MAIVVINGCVVDPEAAETGMLHVEVRRTERQRTETISRTTTRMDGTFSIEIDEVLVQANRETSAPRLAVRVLRGEQVLEIAHGDDFELASAREIELTITLARSGHASPLVVSGTVSNVDGSPLTGFAVFALRLMIGGKQTEIGRTTTDGEGRFRIRCSKVRPASPTVIGVEADGAELVRSGLICDTSGAVTTNLVVVSDIYQSAPEFERLNASMAPLLGDVSAKDLTDADLAILSCTAGQPADRLSALRAAARIVDDSAVPVGGVYGLIRQGLPSTRQALLAQSSDVLSIGLTAAVKARIAPALTTEEIAAAVAAMAKLRVGDVLAPKDPHGLSKLLTFAVPDPAVQAAIVAAYTSFYGDPADFWAKTLAGVKGMERVDARIRIELVAGIAALTFGHAPLVGALLCGDARTDVKVAALRDLAKLQLSDWKTLISSEFDGTIVGVPDGITGDTAETKVNHFAQDLVQGIAASLPTAALAGVLSRSGNQSLIDAGALLDEQPDYELMGVQVEQQFPLKDNPTEKQRAAHAALIQLQRVFKLTPNADEVVRLVKAGLISSSVIARLTPQDLAAAADLPIARARQLLQLAVARVTAALGAIGKFGPQTVGATMPAIPTLGSGAYAAQALQPATVLELFGAETLCTCEEFRSLDGYWAYFVSLLFFLAGPAQKELLTRRPDIGNLRFSRANAETDDRYLSLALEVLESVVLARAAQLPAPPGVLFWPSNQTTWTVDQLMAAPEFPNLVAYNLLNDPGPGLPDSYPDPPPPVAPRRTVYPITLPFDFFGEQARAFSGLLGVARGDLMEALQDRTGAAMSPTAAELAQEWLGIPATAWNLISDTGNPKPQSAGLELSNAQHLLDVMGITSSDLVALLNCRFINPPSIAFKDRVGVKLDNTCNAIDATLTGNPPPDDAFFGRVSRFIRLWRALGWPMGDVDLAIWQMSRSTLDGAGLTRIGMLVRLRKEVALPLAELLAWYADIDAVQDTDQPSQLAGLFPALPLPNMPLPFQSWQNGWPATLSWAITDYQPAILSGLGLTAEDLARLSPPDPIGIAALSLLFRQASMARWLNLDIDGFLALRRLIDVGPFTDPSSSRRFLQTTTRLRACGFTLTELRYLLGGEVADDAPSDFVVSTDRAIDFATQLRGLLLPLAADPAKSGDAVVAKVAAWLSLAPAVATALLGAPFTAAGGAVPLDYLANKVTDSTYWLPGGLNSPPAAAAVADLQGLLIQLCRQALLIGRLSLNGAEFGRLASAKLSGWLDLSGLPTAPAAPATFEALEHWLTYRKLASAQPPLPTPLPNPATLLDLLAPEPTSNAGHQWSDAAALWQWDVADTQAVAAAIGMAAAAQDVMVIERVSRILRLLRRGSMTPGLASAWVDGSDPSNPTAWAGTSNDIVSAARACVGEQDWSAAAQPLRNALLVRQRDALLAYLWGAGLPGDTTTSFPDGDDVRDRYLIDPLMGPEFITTRLELALQSIQMFTDHCFDNRVLVNGSAITLGEIKAEHWKNYQGEYRYWQAAVDIWLMPWAYADFTVLDRSNDRFTAFTQALSQRDLTKDSAADALADYLQAVADIASLKICGYYEEVQTAADGTESNVLHVVGRTAATPASYYYTRRDGGNWSPWQKISADIDAGDNSVMIAVFHRKLFVVWPIITMKANDPSASLTVPKAGDSAPIIQPSQHAEFQIGWTALKNGAWSSKQISDTIVPDDWPCITENLTMTNSGSRTRHDDGTLSVHFYPFPDIVSDIVFRAGVGPSLDDAKDQLRICLSLFETDVKSEMLNEISAQATSGNVQASSAPIDQAIVLPAPEFGFTSCTSEPVIHSDGQYGFNYAPLPGTITWSGFLLSENDRRVGGAGHVQGLTLYKGVAPGLPDEGEPWPDPLVTQEEALWITPTAYQLLFSAQYSQPIAQSFFFDDNRWKFFAEYLPNESPPSTVTIYIARTPPIVGGSRPEALLTAQSRLASNYLSRAIGDPDGGASARAATLSVLQNASSRSLIYWPPPQGGIGEYRFYTFCHPTICDFLEALDAQGLSGLLRRDPNAPIQAPAPPQPEFFNARYDSNPAVVDNGHLPNPGVEFTGVNPFGQDNQNIFYYCVGAAATALTSAGRFDDAEWFWRAIFDPMDGSGDPAPQRYWKYEPLRTGYGDTISDLYGLLSADPAIATEALADVQAWTNDPFDPWAVAASRPIALMKIAVRGFLLNLLTQADQLYAQAADQEKLMRAADSYIRALEILGTDPQPLEPTRSARENPDDYYSFNEIAADPPVDASLPEIVESALPPLPAPPFGSATQPTDAFPWSTAVNMIPAADKASGAASLLFCIPRDTSFEQLRQWATTKLGNIRAGLDFNGQPHVYSIYGARLDPAMLARVAAAGIDLGNAAASAGAPRYLRFSVLLQRAKEFVAELKGLSATLLGALTEDSAETLAELRASQEVSLLAATLAVKQQAQAEAANTLASLEAYQEVLTARYNFYSSRQMISPGEGVALTLTEAATVLQAIAGGVSTTAGVVTAFPNFTLGVAGIGGTPLLTVQDGGSNAGAALSEVSRALDLAATLLHAQSGAIATVAGYQRRKDDWDMLANTTQLELAQVAAQIAAQQARVAAAAADLVAFELQQANTQAVNDYLAARVNNSQFRAFRINQLSGVTHQGYLLAFSLAQAAEAAYKFERYPGPADPSPPSFIQFGYWQNNYNGMTAAEQLGNALQQMEFASSTVDPGDKPWPTVALSLAMMAPAALESLRRTGNSGAFTISELQFLRIRPDAYFLRIRRLRVRIPNVTGPYTPVIFKVEMKAQGLRLTGDAYTNPTTAGNALFSPPIDASYATLYTTGRSDESEPAPVADGQYRPFEGFGPAESQFQISFPAAMAALYGASIADVIFEFELTAREATPTFAYGPQGTDGSGAGGAVGALASQDLMRLLRLTTDYPNQWYQAITAPSAAAFTVTIPLAADRFPYAGDQQVTISTLAVMVVWNTTSPQSGASGSALSAKIGGVALAPLAAAPGTSETFDAISDGSAAVFNASDFVVSYGAAPTMLAITLDGSKLPDEWTALATDGATIVPATSGLLDLVILATYSAS